MNTRALTLALVGVLLLGCGDATPMMQSPLVGSWRTMIPAGQRMVVVDLVFQTDGSASYTASATDCAGTLTVTGIRWTASATAITISGTQSCMGTITCPSGVVDCTATNGILTPGDVTYSLSNNNNTLTFGSNTFTRT